MKYLIRDLETKVNELKSNQSPQLIQKIEDLLRDIKGRQEIPVDVRGELCDVLWHLDKNYNTNICSNIPYFVLGIIDKLTAIDRCPKNQNKGPQRNGENSTFNSFPKFGTLTGLRNKFNG